MARVLIACERSGIVREAFRRKGHDAWSCDLAPAEDGSPYHIEGDARDQLVSGCWDLMIAHPDCTYLTNSAAWAFKDGPYHQRVKPGTLVGAARRAARKEALAFYRQLWAAPIDRICIENPPGAASTAVAKPTQYIQPHQFGEDASKITGLLLKNLPPLIPTEAYPPRIVEHPKGSGKMVNRWGNQTDSGQNRLTPGPDRWMDRSRFYQGWADAMADQWGVLL